MNPQPHIHDFQFGGRSLMPGFLITYGQTVMRATQSEKSIEKAMRRAVAKHDAGSIAAQKRSRTAQLERESHQRMMLRLEEKVRADLIDPVVERVEVRDHRSVLDRDGKLSKKLFATRTVEQVTRFPSEKEVVTTP